MDIVPELEKRRGWLGPDDRDVQRLDAYDPMTGRGISLQISILGTGGARMIGAVLEPGRPVIGLVENDIAAPASRWEIRGNGLWADHVCETALDHWSYGLEAFALEIDDPIDLIDSGLGMRVPLGWELEFESASPAVEFNDPFETTGYQQQGSVHGLFLDAQGEHSVDGVGIRSRWWGRESPTAIDVHEPGASVLSAIDLPDGDGVWRLDLSAGGLSARRMPWG